MFARFSALALVSYTAIAQPSTFLYESNGTTSDVWAYTVNPSTGVITKTPASPFPAQNVAHSVAVTPNNQFAYVANANANTISAYVITPATGSLTPIAGSPFATHSSPHAVAVDPTGRFTYAGNMFSNDISAYTINQTTGALTPVTGSPFASAPGRLAFSIAIDPTGSYLYAPNLDAGAVSAYSINSTTGALTPVSGSPFSAGTQPTWVTVHPYGHFLYVSNSSSVYAFQINSSTGALSPVAGSPFAAGSGGRSLAIDPQGRFLYSADDGSRTVTAFRVNASGSLSKTAGSPFSGFSDPVTLAVDPTSSFLYVGNGCCNTISAFQINQSTGDLVQIAGSPFASGTEPLCFAFATEVVTNQLSIQYLQPAQGGNAGSVTMQVIGNGFQNGVAVKLAGLGPDIVGTNVTVANISALAATFDLTGAAPGVRNLVLTNPDGTSVTRPGEFAVEQGGATQLWVDIVGRDKIRIGVNQAFYITYGNRGNLDSAPSIVSVVIPTSIGFGVDGSQPLIGSLMSELNKVSAFALGSVPAGGTGAIPISLNTTGALTNSSRALASVSRLADPGSFQIGAFLNLLMDLPAATGADFEANLPCQFYSACDSQCASLYLAQLQAYDLAKSQFDAYVNASTAATAELAQAGAQRVLVGAKAAGIALAVSALVGEIGLASAGGQLGEAAESFVSGAVTHVISATQAAYSGDSQTNAQELSTASFDIASASTDAATLLNLESPSPSETAKIEAATIGTLVTFLQGAIGGMSAEFDQYFALRLARQNAYNSFLIGAASFCRARDAVETCHNGISAGATPCGSPQLPPPPNDPGDDRKTITITPAQSVDPNDKVGPQGAASAAYLPSDKPVTYSVFFQNLPTASAPAQSVTITDTLNTNLDLTTLTLGPITFPNQVITPPSIPLSVAPFTTTVDLRPTTNLLVKSTASLNMTTSVLTWTFQSLDGVTGQLPTDPLAGFLPPGAEGSVFFTAMPKSSVTTGMQIQNTATVIFDVNPPINTPTWSNTIDNSKPASHITALSATQTANTFNISWAGTDEGAGIQDYTVYVSDNSGPFTVLQANITATSMTFTGTAGHRYGFYSIARDLVGNVENSKSTSESTTTITTTPTIQCTGCYFIVNGVRATLAFTVGVVGSGSTFTYNYRTSTQTVQFASTTMSQIVVNGNSATFTGQGKLNGQLGYTFAVTATDGGAVGSGLDTVSISITGPNSYSYSTNATIVGGDVVVKQ